MDLDTFAFFTINLVFKLFSLVEFGQTVIDRGVSGLIVNVKITLFGRCMINNFIRSWIVIVCKLFWMPLNCDETLCDEILDKNRGICRMNYAPATPFHPMAYGTRIPCLIDSFENKGLIDAFTWLFSLSPIFFLPPSSHGSMEPGCRLE